jgi:hypothetical protein
MLLFAMQTEGVPAISGEFFFHVGKNPEKVVPPCLNKEPIVVEMLLLEPQRPYVKIVARRRVGFAGDFVKILRSEIKKQLEKPFNQNEENATRASVFVNYPDTGSILNSESCLSKITIGPALGPAKKK